MNRFAIATLVLSGAVAFPSPAAGTQRTITVTGKAQESVPPDIAYVTLYAQADGILMVDAVRKAERLVDDITAAIRTQTDTVRDITVVDVALGVKSQRFWVSDEKETPPRPQIARRIRVSCNPSPAGIHEVIDQAIRAGALMEIPSATSYPDDIRSVAIYALEHSGEVVDRVTRSAMDNARVEAQRLASLAGKNAGDVVRIDCSASARFPFRFPIRIMGSSADLPTEHVGLNPEGITISHTVSVTFELKD